MWCNINMFWLRDQALEIEIPYSFGLGGPYSYTRGKTLSALLILPLHRDFACQGGWLKWQRIFKRHWRHWFDQLLYTVYVMQHPEVWTVPICIPQTGIAAVISAKAMSIQKDGTLQFGRDRMRLKISRNEVGEIFQFNAPKADTKLVVESALESSCSMASDA